MNKVGLYFGSYNPIHNGHLSIANYLLNVTDLEEIWFMVSPHNPLKEQAGLLDENLRFEMATLAANSDVRIVASNFEFKLNRPSYTRDTMDALIKQYPETEFQLVLGEDNMRTFHKWKDFKSLLNDFVINVYPRSHNGPAEEIGDLLIGKNVRYLEFAPLLDISATKIREAIAKGENIRSLVAEEVHTFITENKLYL